MDWLVATVAADAEEAYRRAHPKLTSKRNLRLLRKMKSQDETSNSGSSSSHSGAARQAFRSLSLPPEDDMDDSETNIDAEDAFDAIFSDYFEMVADRPVGGGNVATAARAQVFSPTAASITAAGAGGDPGSASGAAGGNVGATTAARREELARTDEVAERLGRVGAAGNGLYIVLFADDIHSTSQLIDALREFLGVSNFYTDTLMGKFVRALRQYGHLVIWGTREMIAECGPTQVQLWVDGDKRASTRIGAIALERASRLTKHGLFCSIATGDELMVEQRAVCILQWLSAVARSCDPLCQTVAECILPNRHLVPLLRADFKMSARVTKAWYSLLLTLLAVPTFKSHLAAAYCDTYRNVTAKYARGMGVLERTGYTLSVQFLNRVTYVVDLVQGRDLLGKLGKAILETLLVACQAGHLNRRLNPNHSVLTHRRYSPCVSDLKCVLNVKGMPRIFACEEATFLEDWMASLSIAQLMDPHVWRHYTQGHVESESRGWVGAFNLSISLGSLFERLLGWGDDDKSPIGDPASPYARGLLTSVEMTFRILTKGVERWQRSEMLFYDPTPCTPDIEPHRRAPCSLPFSTVAAKRGTPLAMKQLPVSQVTPFSFHLPLHRFVSSCLRELCIRTDDVGFGMTALSKLLRERLVEREYDDLFRGLMEFPILVLSRAAQIRSGLWRRSGPGLKDQVLNYAEPPFCRTMRDADLLMIQFAVLGTRHNQSSKGRLDSDVGIATFINLLIHRLGLFDIMGFNQAPTWDFELYLEQSSKGLYPRELAPEEAPTVEEHSVSLPSSYSTARDAASALVLLEEFLHLIIIFCTELPLLAPEDRSSHTKQAQWKLFREVVHRLASGPKTHSELSEVQHVLSHWDNLLLSEEGKLINPDDASGAALGTVLAEVAERKMSRGKLEPDKWEMKRSAWESYDPAFFHISLRSHQTAAESRPKPRAVETAAFGWEARPYAPNPLLAHGFFQRLRRDTTTDATVLVTTYRVLHLHCRKNAEKDLDGLWGKTMYESKEMSETALARAVHILTLGAYAWMDADDGDANWREKGGGSPGSIFFERKEEMPPPVARDWVDGALLADPTSLVDCPWYEGEENVLLLLQRLAVSGGLAGGFVAQDKSVRSGAAWLCDFSVRMSPKAASLLGPNKTTSDSSKVEAKGESELERRKRMAKENAMAKMKAQAAKFASMMDVELDESEGEVDQPADADEKQATPSTPARTPTPMRANSLGSAHSSVSSVLSSSMSDNGSVGVGVGVGPQLPLGASDSNLEQTMIPARLLRVRPRCIICNCEETNESRQLENDGAGEGQRKRSRRKTENALGFVGYSQASTVLKGGGGAPQDLASSHSTVRDFVGTHVALCGHAVHSECCESYLTTVSHREDRVIGKRDEFRCPLCQRLSNCLVPFIDVGIDWIDSPTTLQVNTNAKSEAEAEAESMELDSNGAPVLLHDFLSSSPWWVCRHNDSVVWDEQSAFIDSSPETPMDVNEVTQGDEAGAPRKQSRGRRAVRSLKKKDLYAAWNAMMKTPRFVRRKLRPRLSSGFRDSAVSRVQDLSLNNPPEPEESSGETMVWRRFMDQVSDISYRADSKRLGDDRLHELFGEFRHYVVEKHAYNMANQFVATTPIDVSEWSLNFLCCPSCSADVLTFLCSRQWPSCMFTETLGDNRRQEMSREKLLSKLLQSIQCFTYSCCCEAFEARRIFRKSVSASSEKAGLRQDSSTDSVLSKFGISGLACDGKLVILPRPSPEEDDGSQPFDGRLGKLRYLALAAMAAAGAVASDLVQLVLPFPVKTKEIEHSAMMDVENPLRAPIAYPLLFGHVLTHVVAAMCASCGRGRAHSDALDLVWSVPFSGNRGSFSLPDDYLGDSPIDTVTEDCEGFFKLGLLARILQVLLSRLRVHRNALAVFRSLYAELESDGTPDCTWIRTCCKLLEVALSEDALDAEGEPSEPFRSPGAELFRDACSAALSSASNFLADAGVILQVLVPGVMARYQADSEPTPSPRQDDSSSRASFERLRLFFRMEPIDEMLDSPLVQKIVSHWYETARRHGEGAISADESETVIAKDLRSRLFRTQGFRNLDWPSAGFTEGIEGKATASKDRKETKKASAAESAERQPHDDMPAAMEIESIQPPSTQTSTFAELVHAQSDPALVTFSSKKTVPLLGGFSSDTIISAKAASRPRVAVIPTSYTDLYAELGSLLPDCEQTAVCLICGAVLNAGGKGECTKHSYKCGAGAGMFFLLQECSGLIMHKSKAAYIHSPYVDSHGETPQFRGRPLNLDLVRYEHLREIWLGHAIRQTVVAERGSSRQVILPDFY